MREPRFHRARNGALLRALGAQRRGSLRRRGRDVAEHEIAVTGERLRIGRDDEIGAERERLLQVAGGSSDVHCHDRAVRVGGLHEPGDVERREVVPTRNPACIALIEVPRALR